MKKPKGQATRPLLVIFCEGELTEPSWLASVGRHLGNRALDIRPGPGVPLTLVRRAMDEVRQIRREGRSDEAEVWCIFDVDEHPGLAEARHLAATHGIQLAISNPCFELWLLLHFRDQPGMQHRDAVARMLREFQPAYAKQPDFGLLGPLLPVAIARARRLSEDAASMDEAGRNPTTDVYRLVERIEHPRPTVLSTAPATIPDPAVGRLGDPTPPEGVKPKVRHRPRNPS